MVNKINELCEKYYSNIVDIRHELHKNPEVGYEEFKTSNLVADTLKNLGIEVQTNVAKTGVIGLIKVNTLERQFYLELIWMLLE